MDNVSPLYGSQLKEFFSKYSPFFVEVKKKFLFTLIIFIIATLAGFAFYDKIIKFLVVFLSLEGVNIVFTSPFQFINLAMSCGVATGLVVTFPLIVLQTLAFIKPALKENELKLIVRSLPFSLFLFLSGFIFGVMIMKWQIAIFLDKAVDLGIGNILDISKLISSVIMVAVLMGFAFQFPIIILIFLRLGILKRKTLSKLRIWVYIGSLIFAILLPPDSILADILLALPLIILFELTLIINKIFGKSKVITPDYAKLLSS